MAHAAEISNRRLGRMVPYFVILLPSKTIHEPKGFFVPNFVWEVVWLCVATVWMSFQS